MKIIGINMVKVINKTQNKRNDKEVSSLIANNKLIEIIEKNWSFYPEKLFLSPEKFEWISFICEDRKGSRIFCKLTQDKTENDYKTQYDYINKLTEKGVLVATLKQTNQNDYCVPVGDYTLTVQEYIEGVDKPTYTISDVEKVAMTQAKMHNISSSMSFQKNSLSDNNNIEKRMRSFMESVPPSDDLKEAYDIIKDYINNLNQDCLRESFNNANILCHFDLHSFNVLWVNDAPVVIDFDDLCFESPENDLMYSVWHWTRNNSPQNDTLSQEQKEIATSYLKSYFSHRGCALKSEELLFALDLIGVRIMVYEYFRSIKINDASQLKVQLLELINWTGDLKGVVADYFNDEKCFWKACYLFYM